MSKGSKKTPLEERFWAKVNKTETCWVWVGGRPKGRYGEFSVGKSMKRAHRISWELANGPIPTGLYVLHSCDNPPCVNPNHLFLGTQTDNVHDMENKKRGIHFRGEDNGRAKLTVVQVFEIRKLLARGDKKARIAKQYSINPVSVAYIENGKNWGWLK